MSRPSPARDRILRTLLSSNARGVPRKGEAIHSMYALAQRSGASFPWVHEVTKGLIDQGWIDEDLQIKDAAAVFAWWRDNTIKPTIKSFHVPDPASTIEALATDTVFPYAITTYYAENRLQGHLFPRRMDAYIRKSDLPHAKKALLDHGAQLGGTNFRFWIRDDALLDEAFEVSQGPARLRYAPVAQVILDLMFEGGSAGEAADMLIERSYA